VAAALKEYPGKIRLLKVGLPGFRFQPGFTSWRFMNLKSKAELEARDKDSTESYFDEYENYEQVPND
jgi:hypothetical protein